MKIQLLDYAGILPAMTAMRNPMNSWFKNDTQVDFKEMRIKVGSADKALSEKLQKAGPEHAKHLRMIMVWADISAPRYWWTEFDTYRYGVEKVSCSTMHKLMSRELTTDDFETDAKHSYALLSAVHEINMRIGRYHGEEDPEAKKAIWREIIQILPQSYIQKRTVMMSYAALRNIYRQREGHKLKEWQEFREWCEDLPESWMITE